MSAANRINRVRKLAQRPQQEAACRPKRCGSHSFTAVKGAYRLTFADLALNLDRCLALLVPTADATEGAWQTTLQHALYLYHRFPQRTWIAVALLSGPNDHAQLAMLGELAALSGLPLVTAGDVHIHVRSRRAEWKL